MAIQAKVLTVSTSVAAGTATDRGGDALAEAIAGAGFEVVERRVVPDDADQISGAVRGFAAGFSGIVVTTGGTGFSPTDYTPEATKAVLEREAPGLAEAMRLVNPLGRLSRAAAGSIGQAVVLNTPGSPSGAVECFGAVSDVLGHAVTLLSGENPHPHSPRPH